MFYMKWGAQNEAGAHKEYIINCNRPRANLAQSYGGSNGVAIVPTKNVGVRATDLTEELGRGDSKLPSRAVKGPTPTKSTGNVHVRVRAGRDRIVLCHQIGFSWMELPMPAGPCACRSVST
jgi:hypothetical protein